MAMLNLSEGSSEYRPTSLTSWQAAKETVPPGAKAPEPRWKWLKEFARHLLMVVFLVKVHRDSLLNIYYTVLVVTASGWGVDRNSTLIFEP